MVNKIYSVAPILIASMLIGGFIHAGFFSFLNLHSLYLLQVVPGIANTTLNTTTSINTTTTTLNTTTTILNTTTIPLNLTSTNSTNTNTISNSSIANSTSIYGQSQLASSSLSIPEPLAAVSKDSSGSIKRGHTISIVDAGATGGVPPYTYQWLASYNGTSSINVSQSPALANTLCADSAQTTTCTIITNKNTPAGKYVLQIEVTDSASTTVIDDGFTLYVQTNVTANVTPALIVNSGSVSFNGTASGGSGNYIISWSVTGLDGQNKNLTWTSANYIINSTCNPSITNTIVLTKWAILGNDQNGNTFNLTDGNYSVKFTATDASNLTNSNFSTTNLDVDASPPTTPINWTSSPGQGTLMDSMNSINGNSWIINYGIVTNSLKVNTTTFVEGDSSISFTISSNSNTADLDTGFDPTAYAGAIIRPVNLNLNNAANFYFWFYIKNSSELVSGGQDGVVLEFANSNGDSSICPIQSDGIQSGWTPVVIARSACSGNVVWSNPITSMQFRVNLANNITNATVNFDNLRYNYAGGLFNKAQVILTFDGAWNSTYYNVTKILIPNHQTAVAYIVTNQINSAIDCNPVCITSNQLISLYGDGWDISSHTVDHANLVTNSTANDIYQLSTSYNTLINSPYDFTRSADIFAYPNGAYNADAIADVISTKYITARALDYGITQPNMYPNNPYNLSYRVQSATMTPSVTSAQAINYINQVIPENGLLVLTFHVIQPNPCENLAGYTGLGECLNESVEYSTANFTAISNYLRTEECMGLLNVTTFSAYYNVVNDGAKGDTGTPQWCIPITVTITPSNTQIDTGQNDILTANAVGGSIGSGNTIYAWYSANTFNANALSGNALSANAVFTTPALISNTQYYVQVTDSSNDIGTANYIIMVNPLPTIALAASTPTTIDPSKSVSFTNTITGGTAPFSYSYKINGPANAVINGNTITFPTAGIYNVSEAVTDHQGMSASSANVLVTVSSALSISIMPSSNTINPDQSVTFTNTTTGGTGPFTYAYTTNGPANVIVTNNIITFPTLGTYNVSETVTDNQLANAISANVVINVVSIPTTTIASGGGGNVFSGVQGSTGAGGGTSSPKAVVVKYSNNSTNQTGYYIFNLTQDGTVNFTIGGQPFHASTLGGKRFNVTLNFINPTSIGVTVNGHSYNISVGQTIELNDPPNYAYYAELISIDYAPILHTVELAIYGAPLLYTTSPSNTTTIASTTTTVATTTLIPQTSTTSVNTTTVAQQSTPSNSLPLTTVVAPIGVAIAIAIALGYVYSRSSNASNTSKSKKKKK